jgi:glycolate oxidase iron-sulfur subunit
VVDRQLIDECVHCGFCLPACPTYQSWGQEMDSPRGRIYLMKAQSEGRAPLSATTVMHFDRCLGCLACVTACPSGVKYDQLIEQTRAEVEQHHPRTLWDRCFRALLFSVLPYPTRLRVMSVLHWLYRTSGLRWVVRRSGVLRLLPKQLAALDALAPSLSWSELQGGPLASAASVGKARSKVALLPGCVQSVYFQEVNRATIRVLSAEGCDVVVPSSLGCCGALSLHSGREDEARELACKAIAALEAEQVDAIAVNAAGCGSTMKHWGRLFEADPTWGPRARALAAKVRDVNELLVELGPRAPRHPLPLHVAYHDACHLSHGQGIRSQPRSLLNAIPELKLLEIPDADQCCGSAGIYNLLEPESAELIGQRKAERIAPLPIDILVSANPGCTLQIQRHLGSKRVRTAHPIQLLDASIRGARL